MSSRYIHGTTPVEQDRLSLLNRLMNGRTLEALAPQPGERILDLGCGLGQLTAGMAERVGPEGLVVGVEREGVQLERARANVAGSRNVDLRRGDVLAPPLAEDELFDVAHARFVLEHLPDPAALVALMVRAVRPGGRVVLMDDDHDLMRFWPPCPEGDAAWRAYFETLGRIGNDPHVGRKLPDLLERAGAVDLRCRLIDYSACRGQPEFQPAVLNLIEVVRGAREAVLEGGADADRFDAGLDALAAWSEEPGATIWYAMSWAEGRRPA